MPHGTLTQGQHLISDRFALRGAVTAVRNAHMRANQQRLLAAGGSERRASARVRLDLPVRLTSAVIDLEQEFVYSGGDTVIHAVCRNISLGGIGLVHRAPFPGNQAIVRFEIPAEEPICLAVEVVWSNREDDGSWYSGVRVMGMTDSKPAKR